MIWAGRDEETVNNIIEKQTEAMCNTIGCPPEAVRVIVYQIHKSHWSVAGKPSS